ncbi:MAG: GH39 family glycosyl hydrolase [Nocardioidaceae bacterium]
MNDRATEARADWEERIYRRTESGAAAGVELAAPADLTAVPGRGQVSLRWSPVAEASGYVISRADGEGDQPGAFVALEHGNSDVEPVPETWYADAMVEPGRTYHWRVQAVSAIGLEPGPASATVSAAATTEPAAPVTVAVDAGAPAGRLERVWEMVGSERISSLWLEHDDAGNTVGKDLAGAYAAAHDELGVRRVRAHAIFHDDVHVFHWPEGGTPSYDFSGVDDLVDRVIATGLRPVLELGFMPRDLATDPGATTFQYEGIVSPPKDWAVWGELNGRLAAHLVERYGIDEVAGWGFEVWNEPNLEVFWTGTKRDYMRLYAEAATAIKAVNERLLVGGPATAASEWVEDICAFCAETGTPLDFVSTHSYGNAPVDVGPSLQRHGFDKAQVWWTEWGVGHTHFAPVHDTAYAAPFCLRGYKAAQGTVDALSYWVVSDHFEELGRPPKLLHGGFGLMTVGNLRKPRWHAVALAEGLADDLLATTVDGDGARTLVDTWASAHDDGRIDVLVWNIAPDARLYEGRADLDRTVEVRLSGLTAATYDVELARVDNEHSSIRAHVDSELVWPDAAEWERLRGLDGLHTETAAPATPDAGAWTTAVEVPMPGIVRLRLTPRG